MVVERSRNHHCIAVNVPFGYAQGTPYSFGYAQGTPYSFGYAQGTPYAFGNAQGTKNHDYALAA